MTQFYGEIVERERNEEAISIFKIRGASGLDRSRNNGLSIKWIVKDSDGHEHTLNASYIGDIRILRACAKAHNIDIDSLVDITSPNGQKMLKSYPQFLREESAKKHLFQLMDDQQFNEMMQKSEIEVRFKIMSNKFWIKNKTGRETFATENNVAYGLMGKILIEKAAMNASARASNAVIDARVQSIYEKYLDNPDLSDTECRTRLNAELEKLRLDLREELPQIFHDELEKWSQKFLFRNMEMLLGEEEESNND